jgi:hypothetical protein
MPTSKSSAARKASVSRDVKKLKGQIAALKKSVQKLEPDPDEGHGWSRLGALPPVKELETLMKEALSLVAAVSDLQIDFLSSKYLDKPPPGWSRVGPTLAKRKRGR